MKLVRYGDVGFEKPGLLDRNGVVRDLSNHIADVSGSILDAENLQELRSIDTTGLPCIEATQRIGACLSHVGKIICIGLNYADHATEVGKDAPPNPVIFMKAPTAICGPDDPIEIPRGSAQTDWEIELGVVIGSRAKYVRKADAMDYVAGYCTINDVSEREFQSDNQGQWTKGKSHDTHAPIGPWLVTSDDVSDPLDLTLWCEVDGILRQNGSTSTMIFGVDFLVSYLSQFMTLEPGDIIATGTPAGVGKGIKPNPVFLKAGMRMRCGVESLGTQEHLLVDA